MTNEQNADFGVEQPSQRSLAIARTLLANYRTVLAYLRTGLAFAGGGIAVIKLFEFPYREAVAGVLFVVAVALSIYGVVQYFRVRRMYAAIRPADLADLERRFG